MPLKISEINRYGGYSATPMATLACAPDGISSTSHCIGFYAIWLCVSSTSSPVIVPCSLLGQVGSGDLVPTIIPYLYELQNKNSEPGFQSGPGDSADAD